MHKSIYKIAFFSIAFSGFILLLSSCSKDFLDREPLSQLSPGSSFNSASQLQLYTNSFYNDIIPDAASLYNEQVDNIVVTSLSNQLTGARTVPVSGGGWSWGALRNINFFLQNYTKGHLPENVSAPYVGVAKFFRAYFYFNMVQTLEMCPGTPEPLMRTTLLCFKSHVIQECLLLILS